MTHRKVVAFLWDFDGTLVDTRRRNFEVTRRIVRDLGAPVRDVPALSSPHQYDQAQRRTANWREFYRRYLGLSEEETDRAGKLWSAYQLKDVHQVPTLEGVGEALAALRDYPHGIVSQNAREVIQRTLSQSRLEDHFEVIVGYAEVPLRKQKPDPGGLLLCLQCLSQEQPGYAFYIGDHETDMHTVANANQALERRGEAMRVVSIAATYCLSRPETWRFQPDYVLDHPSGLVDIKKEFEKTEA
ncbi:MAG: HAD family hydrolase [Acidobacteriota bacterium]